MTPFTTVDSLVVPLDRANVDTDAIIPKQFIKSIRRSGYGPFLFDEWRYLDRGELGMNCAARPRNPDFPLDQPRYAGAQILLARENFGCGSSREHAVWALRDQGLRVVVAPSFADIFFGNCFKSGVLPIVADATLVDHWFAQAQAAPGFRMKVDLATQTIATPDGASHAFDIDPPRKACLLEGLDDIALTLARADDIRRFETAHRAASPWLFADERPAAPA